MSNFSIDPVTNGVCFENIAELDNQNFHEVNGAAIQLSPLNSAVSPMRSVMFATHLSQSLVLDEHEPSHIISGMEREYARSTVNVKFPCDARIVANVPKFTSTMVNPIEIDEQPRNTIIFIDHNKVVDDGVVYLDAVHVDRVHKNHQSYGWLFKKNEDITCRPNDVIRKGTVLAKSPRIDENESYNYGVNLKTAVMSINEITEDGYVVSESAAKRLRTKTYITMSVSFGKFLNGDIMVPLNLYGENKDNYRIFPAIGEKVRDDNLLFAARLYDPKNSGMDMSYSKLQNVDMTHDKKFFLPSGYAGSKVVDITISKAGEDHLNPIFTKQVSRLYDSQIASYRKILRAYRDMRQKHPNLKLSPSFNIDLVEIMKELKEGFARKVIPARKKAPLAEWTVDITLECEMDLSISCKLSGNYGNKGITVDIWPDDRMPVDKFGTRAEFIIDGDSSGKRMNWPVLGSQYYSCQLDQARRTILGTQSIDAREKTAHAINASNSLEEQFSYLLGLYKAVSPMYHKELIELYNAGNLDPKEFVDEFIRFPDIYIPPYCPVVGIESLARAEKYHPLDIGPVTYKLENGKEYTTEEDIMIGDMYMMFLEKNGTEWSSVSSPKRQHFGLFSKLSNSNKHSMPWRENSMRFWGEPEAKAVAANCGHEQIGRTINRSNDPIATQALHRSIMNTKTPSAIKEAVDYSKIPTNGSRANLFVKHIFYCTGFEITRDVTHVKNK